MKALSGMGSVTLCPWDAAISLIISQWVIEAPLWWKYPQHANKQQPRLLAVWEQICCSPIQMWGCPTPGTYGKIYFILGRFLPGRSIIVLLLLSHMIQCLGMNDSYFWLATFQLCFRLFGKCETAHLHRSKLGLYYCCFGDGDSLGVYIMSTETPCGPGKMWIWTSISGTNEQHSQQMLESETDEVQTSGFTSTKHFLQRRKNRIKKIWQKIEKIWSSFLYSICTLHRKTACPKWDFCVSVGLPSKLDCAVDWFIVSSVLLVWMSSSLECGVNLV